MIKVKYKGDFKKTSTFFHNAHPLTYKYIIRHYAQKGLKALQDATPKHTGNTSLAWAVDIIEIDGNYSINYTNSAKNGEYGIVKLIIRGHGTKNGLYVAANNFVKPAIEPIFAELRDKIWKEAKGK